MSQEPGELVTTTNRDYDLAEISKATRGILMGCAMVGFMHLYLGYTNPLVIQSILPLKNALESNMAKLWVWGQPATGDLKRPFKAPPGLFGAAGQAVLRPTRLPSRRPSVPARARRTSNCIPLLPV